MFTLFSRIILTNWKSLLILFLVTLFASTGFITLRQVTTNIELLVANETKPLFGADIIVSYRGYASGDILPQVSPFLEGKNYSVAERREFSTTLFDKDGKTGLIQVIAFSGTYPQRGILTVSGGIYTKGAVATPGVLEKFTDSGSVLLDNKKIPIVDTILDSSDLGFSLGTENHLIILPKDLLSGSLLLSSGSRLNHSLYISFENENHTREVVDILKNNLADSQFRVRSYEERTERNLETISTLTDYITLILLVSSIFAFVILRSAHESFFENLSRTLRVTEILGLTQNRQRILLLMLYTVLFPFAFILGIGLTYFIIVLINHNIPEAQEFQFIITALPHSLSLLIALGVMAFFPAWWTMGIRERGQEFHLLSSSIIRGKNEITQEYLLSYRRKLGNILRYLVRRAISSHPDIFVPILMGIVILIMLFENPLFSILAGLGFGLFFLLFNQLLRYLYIGIFQSVSHLKTRKFYFYDAIRTLIKPLTPTIPITLSLISVTIFFLAFSSFSLAFRSKLIIDSTLTANIYAINILEADKDKVGKIIGSGALMYDILRARISKINGEPLAKYIGEENPSGEFTREFNITTTSLENKIIRGKKIIEKGEVSVDYEFSKRLGISLGDTITFLLSGREIILKVANIRESLREGFQPFFYFSFHPGEFKNAPRTYFIAEYTTNIEQWKKSILAASGPHVTFIDIESILKIVRDISSKVLSVISLFFIIVFLFAVGAIFAFFIRMGPIERMKTHLYNLFGATKKNIHTSLTGARITIFIVSYILSILIGGVLSYFILSMGGFFRFSFSDYLMISAVTGIVYSLLMLVMRK